MSASNCRVIIGLILIQFASGISNPDPYFHSIKSNVENFIVGGRQAAEGQFPYVVSLRTQWDDHLCGGGILNQRWILSAAHCTIHVPIPYVVAGSTRISEGGENYGIEQIINHPNYNSERNPFRDDICVMRTNRSIEFNQLVQPIQIDPNRINRRASAVIAGWGFTEGGNHLIPGDFFPVASNDLNYIEVNILTHLECYLRMSFWSLFLRQDHICTYARNVGVCTFDSGSPVVSNGRLVGIVSFVVPCAIGRPDWGPRMSSYEHWINSHIWR